MFLISFTIFFCEFLLGLYPFFKQKTKNKFLHSSLAVTSFLIHIPATIIYCLSVEPVMVNRVLSVIITLLMGVNLLLMEKRLFNRHRRKNLHRVIGIFIMALFMVFMLMRFVYY